MKKIRILYALTLTTLLAASANAAPTIKNFPALTGGGSSGVSSLNGQTGAVLAPITEANVAALTAQASAGLSEGAEAYIVTLKAMFVLQASTTTAVPLVNIAASGKTGYQWIRQLVRNPVWEVVAAWTIDPTNTTGVASDECVGTSSACPLLTYQELGRRLSWCFIAQATTVTALGDMQAGDNPFWSYDVVSFIELTFVGTPTTIYTSTVTSFTPMTFGSAAADDAEFGDTAVPSGSFTAAGALAQGVRIKRPNGTKIYMWVAKDLGSTTARGAQPFNPSSTNSQPAFSVGDAYVLERLPKILNWRSVDWVLIGTKMDSFDLRSSTAGWANIFFLNCYFTALSSFNFQFGAVMQNCCLDAGTLTIGGGGAGNSKLTMTGGLAKGTGGTGLFFSGTINSEGQIYTNQGVKWELANGTFNGAQWNFYDVNSGTLPIIYGDTGARYHLLGAINGKGNTLGLVAMHAATVFVNGTFAIASMYNSSMTSNAAPIQAGTTTSTSQINIQTDGNGVIFSQ